MDAANGRRPDTASVVRLISIQPANGVRAHAVVFIETYVHSRQDAGRITADRFNAFNFCGPI